MKQIPLILICFLSLSLSKCKREQDALPQMPNLPEKKSELSLVWKTYLDEVTSQETYSINPMLNVNGDVLMSNYSTRNNREPIKLYDGKTGKLKWTWDDYLRDEEYFFDDCHLVHNGILILSAYNATYALDMVTGQTVWKNYIDTMYGSHMVFSDGDYIYKGFMGEAGTFKSYIFRTKYNVLNWELVCTYTDSTNTFDKMSVSTINFANNKKGERVMLFPLGYVDANKYSAVVCCYNLIQHKFEWIKDYSDKYLEFRVAKAITNDDKYFVHTVWGPTWYLVALNIEDGSIAWQNTQPDFGVELFVYQNKLISLCNRSSPIVCLNPGTGSVIWEQNFASQSNSAEFNFVAGDANVFKHYLFSTQCGYMLALDLNDGRVVVNKKNGAGCLQYGIAINEQDRTFYVQDRTYVNCFKLPDEITY